MRNHPPLQDFPVCLQLRGRRALVVGAGTVATRRILSLVRAGARVVVVAPEAADEVRELAESRAVEWKRRAFRRSDARGAFLIFAATCDRRANRAVARAGADLGALVNACDDPAVCTFTMPAVARRGSMSLAVSSGGTSPETSARVRDRLARSAAWTGARNLGRRASR